MPVLFSINIYIDMLSCPNFMDLFNMFLYITDRQSAKLLKLKKGLKSTWRSNKAVDRLLGQQGQLSEV